MKTLLFSLLIILSFSALSQDLAEEYKQKAFDLFEKGDYNYALVMIDKAIELDQENEWLRFKKAEIEFELFGPEKSLSTVKEALIFNPNSDYVYNEIGLYFKSMNLTDSAINNFNKALELAQNDTWKYAYIVNRGTAKYKNRDFQGALNDYESALIFDPNKVSALNNISLVYDELDMPEKAIDVLKRVVELDSVAAPCINIGFLYTNLDSLEQAIYWFNEALIRAPENPLIFSNRGLLIIKKESTRKRFQTSINLSNSTQPILTPTATSR